MQLVGLSPKELGKGSARALSKMFGRSGSIVLVEVTEAATDRPGILPQRDGAIHNVAPAAASARATASAAIYVITYYKQTKTKRT